MKKTRVTKGEKYWYVYLGPRKIVPAEKVDHYNSTDDDYFINDNYFCTKEEAEEMAEKIRKVLKGADVIEMPSEEEAAAKREELYPKEYNSYTGYYETPEQIEGFWDCYDWLKSKIVK